MPSTNDNVDLDMHQKLSLLISGALSLSLASLRYSSLSWT